MCPRISFIVVMFTLYINGEGSVVMTGPSSRFGVDVKKFKHGLTFLDVIFEEILEESRAEGAQWAIRRVRDDGNLKFEFSNSDTTNGHVAIDRYAILAFDGFNNHAQLHINTCLFFGDATYLYCKEPQLLSTNSSLETEGNIASHDGLTVVQGTVAIEPLSSEGVLHTNNDGIVSTFKVMNEHVDDAAAILDTKLDEIKTAGKVNNSATTASPDNSPNTIVSRDEEGAFSGGRITAQDYAMSGIQYEQPENNERIPVAKGTGILLIEPSSSLNRLRIVLPDTSDIVDGQLLELLSTQNIGNLRLRSSIPVEGEPNQLKPFESLKLLYAAITNKWYVRS